MTKQQKIDLIRQKCIEANPSILDLKLGCKIKNPFTDISYDKPNIFIAKNRNVVTAYRPSYSVISDFTWKRKHNDQEYEWEILGRDIGLADVLLAIAKHPAEYTMWVDGTDTFDTPHFIIKQEKTKNVSSYNLLKPLHEQDEQLINFIYELLK